MAKREILAGIADQSIDVFIQDSSSSVGAGLTGLVFNTAGLTCYYRKGATGTPTALTLATQTVGGAHSDGGFVAVDGTNCPGQYRLDLSDTIVATAGMVTLYLRGATNMAPCVLEIEVVNVNKYDAVRGGMTSLPNANAEAAGGLYTRGTGAGQINQPANGMIDVNAMRHLGTAYATPSVAGVPEVDVTHWASNADIGDVEVAFANITEILADTGTTLESHLQTLLTRLSALRAGYLDNLNVGGNVASSAEVTSIQNNTRVVRVVPDMIERPDSGTITYRIELLLYDSVGNMEAPDSAPTIALVNQAGTDRSSRLDSTTMALVSTGRYRAIYTADVADTLEQLVWAFSVVEGGNTRVYGNQSVIVDTTAVDFTAADRTKLDTIHTNVDATVSSRASQTSVNDLPTNAELATALEIVESYVWDAQVLGHLSPGTFGAAVSSIQTTVVLVVEDTNELQTDWVNGGRLDLILDSRSATLRIKKNTAFNNFVFYMETAAGDPATGLTITAQRMLDGAAFAACANAASEVSAGWYKIDLAATDVNADSVALKFTAPGAKARNMLVLTQV